MTDPDRIAAQDMTLATAIALAQAASDDAERAIRRADKAEMDLRCLQESTVDAKAFAALALQAAALRKALEGLINSMCVVSETLMDAVTGPTYIVYGVALTKAEAALSLPAPEPGSVGRLVLVPEEPTEAMLDAGHEADKDGDRGNATDIWQAMIEALAKDTPEG